MANYWYVYLGPATPTIQFLFPSNYAKTSTPAGCNPGHEPCVIYAPAVAAGLIPGSFSTRLKSYIATGTASALDQPTTANSKLYFYVASI